MNCETMIENIPLIINSSFNIAEEKQVLEHLMECEVCRQELAFWVEISEQQRNYENEFTQVQKKQIYSEIENKKTTAMDITKKAVKVYFKVIESIL